MSVPIQSREPAGLAHRVAQAWEAWQRRRGVLAEISEPEEPDHIARDVGPSRGEVCVVAGKWPELGGSLK